MMMSMPILVSEVDNFMRALAWEEGLDEFNFAPDLGRLVSASWSGIFAWRLA